MNGWETVAIAVVTVSRGILLLARRCRWHQHVERLARLTGPDVRIVSRDGDATIEIGPPPRYRGHGEE